MNRLERISAILVTLQSRSVITAREIAEQFGISLRTVYRDIRSLEESGIPVYGEAGTGYSLVDGFKLPPLMFTTEEAIAFLMAEKLIGTRTDSDTYSLFRSGMDKIRAVLRTAEKDVLEDFSNYLKVDGHYTYYPESPGNILQPLLKAVRKKCTVTVSYRAINREVTRRELEPQGVVFMGETWYLLAWCKLRNDYRTFNIGRILELTITGEDFSKDHLPLHKLIKTLYADDPMYNVTLKVEKTALRRFGHYKYYNGFTREEDLDDDYVIQYYKTYSLEHFGRWFLSFADKAEILEPANLKDIVRELVRKIKIE